MKTVLEAFKLWQETAPKGGGSCCGRGHFFQSNSFHNMHPLPDEMVCDRERAWREYVSLRDAKGVTHGGPAIKRQVDRKSPEASIGQRHYPRLREG